MYVNKKPKAESAETKEQTNSTTTATSECRDQLGGRGQGRGRGRSQGHGRGGGRGAYRSAKGRPCQSYRGGGGGQRDNRQKDRACYRCNKVGNLAKDCRVSMPAYDRNDERGRGRGRRGGGAPKRFRQSRDDGDEYREGYDDGDGGGGRYRNDRRRHDADYVGAYDGGGGGGYRDNPRWHDNVGYAGAYDDGDYVDHVYTSFETTAVINQHVMYVLDGGCSVSQTHIQSDLINITPHNRRVEVANGGILHTLARGSRGVRHISYTPGCKRLLSEKALLKQGYGVVKMNTERADIVCRTTNRLRTPLIAALAQGYSI